MLHYLFYALFALLLMGCTQEENPPVQPPTQIIPTPLQPVSSPTAPVNEEWRAIADGLEQRLYVPDALLAQMVTLRIDPTRYAFRVHYRPYESLMLADWQALLPDAIAIINANFFNPENTAEGLLITDGVPYGRAYTQRGGMFTWQAGVPNLRVNWLEPYQQGEPIEQAIQAFPMLVIDGQQSYTNANDQRPTRRSIIGIDEQGRVILMATPALGLGLYDLSAYLPTTDIDFTRALNLDGGRSTMFYIAPDYMIHSVEPVPTVLAIYPR